MNFFTSNIVGNCSNYNNKLIIQSTLKETKWRKIFIQPIKEWFLKKQQISEQKQLQLELEGIMNPKNRVIIF